MNNKLCLVILIFCIFNFLGLLGCLYVLHLNYNNIKDNSIILNDLSDYMERIEENQPNIVTNSITTPKTNNSELEWEINTLRQEVEKLRRNIELQPY